jgi:hypothetical protein
MSLAEFRTAYEAWLDASNRIGSSWADYQRPEGFLRARQRLLELVRVAGRLGLSGPPHSKRDWRCLNSETELWYQQCLGELERRDPPRPAVPTRDFCLLPPNIIRWEESREVQQRLWHLLGLLLERSQGKTPTKTFAVAFAAVEELLARGKEVKGKYVSNVVNELNAELEAIGFPWAYSTKDGHIVAG